MSSGTAPEFADYFSAQAARYATFRPRYPEALFAWLASAAPGRGLAWDAGTGSGQAAVAVSRHFDRVVATDASADQLKNAVACEGVEYQLAPAERSPLADGTVDLITAAQAVHWFDLERFYSEVRRVARPGGVLAVWCYDRARITPEVEAVLHRFDKDVVAAFWPPQSRYVHDGFWTLPFPFEEIAPPEFVLEVCWTLEELTGYVATWSAVQRYRAAMDRDPMDAVRGSLADAWGEAAARRVIAWDLDMRVGRVG